jgi:histone H3/H4
MADQYAREAARVSALQLAYHAGFDVAQESCVEILADLLLRYVNEVGAGSHHYAELAGRSETNAVDVVRRGVMGACRGIQWGGGAAGHRRRRRYRCCRQTTACICSCRRWP